MDPLVTEETAVTAAVASPAATEQPLQAATPAAAEPVPVASVTATAELRVAGAATAGEQTPLAVFTAAHLQRVECIIGGRERSAVPDLQRGFAAQQVLRELEQSIRLGVLDFCQQATMQGVSQHEIADWLTLSPRTLRHWRQTYGTGSATMQGRGRPLVCSGADALQAVVHFLHRLGPATGLAVLQGEFPAMTRAELQDLLRCYRQAWVGEHSRLRHELHWLQSGRVWAMDYAEAPCWIDGCSRYVLAVRDLASGQQLLWLPLPEATAASTIAELALLFAIYGPPLVLKSDNGSPFSAEETREFLQAHAVRALFSPPRTPSYNGSCEAAIGAMKERTAYQAERHGHPGEWTSADAATARQQANETARPRGYKEPTPAEAWRQRQALGAAERRCFAATVATLEREVRQHGELPLAADLQKWEEAEVQREVLRRALVAHGYLYFTRRRIPLPIQTNKAAKIR